MGRGTLFFSWLLWEQSRWGLLDDFRSHGWCTPAVGHVTRFTMGKAECFLCALGFPWPPASVSPVAVLCSHLIASSWSRQLKLSLRKRTTTHTHLLQDVPRSTEVQSHQTALFLERWQADQVKGGLGRAHPQKEPSDTALRPPRGLRSFCGHLMFLWCEIGYKTKMQPTAFSTSQLAKNSKAYRLQATDRPWPPTATSVSPVL